MKIVIATNAFKESMSGISAAQAVKAGFERVFPKATYFLVPIADGGDGTLDAFSAFLPSRRVKLSVIGPLGVKARSEYLLSEDGNVAVIEMALASGLAMLALKDRNALKTTSYGTGELIADALDKGAKRIVVGIGGSATNDGGAGIAAALGYEFRDSKGKSIVPVGGNLATVKDIDSSRAHPGLKKAKITVACDVKNPLLGKNGASAIYGPQKGATKDGVKTLENNMKAFSSLVAKKMGLDYREASGAGAAGGAGYGLMTFASASLVPGIDLIAKHSGLSQKIADGNLVITGEGFMDYQSAQGKAPFGVLKMAKKYRKPVIAFCGGVEGEESLIAAGFASVIPIVNRPVSLEFAVKNGPALLEGAAFRTAALIKATGKL